MAVGIYSTKSDIDNRIGTLVQAVRDNLSAVGNAKLWLDAKTDPELIAFAYVQADIDVLRSAVTDYDKLRQIHLGLATQAVAYDFRTFAKLLG